MYDTNKLDTSNIGGHGASPILQMLVDHAHSPLSWINAALSIKWHQQSIIGNRQDKTTRGQPEEGILCCMVDPMYYVIFFPVSVNT